MDGKAPKAEQARRPASRRFFIQAFGGKAGVKRQGSEHATPAPLPEMLRGGPFWDGCLWRFRLLSLHSMQATMHSIPCGVFLLVLLPVVLSAQVDTALSLPPLEITAPPLRRTPPGDRVARWDSTALADYGDAHVATLLERESGVFIKSYGLGSLATTSIRGGSAGHTAVSWNGFSLQSSMLGLLDLSLLPVAFADAVSLQPGGAGALWGSGAIGGVLALENRPSFGHGFAAELQSTLGSFGWWDQRLQLEYGGERFSSVTRLFHQQATNDFPYRLRPDLPAQTQTNAALRQQGALQEFYWRPAPGQQLALHVWWQQAAREIPPTTTQTRSETTQRDDLLRTALHWKYSRGKGVIQARAGFFREQIDYREPRSGLRSLTHFHTLIGEVEGQWAVGGGRQLHLGVNQTFTEAHADAYGEPPQQYRGALFAGLRQAFGQWQAQLSARQAWADGALLPFVPALGLEGALFDWLTLRTKWTRNFRLPTLNDLYWQPGGNPELKAERGWSQELGLESAWSDATRRLTFSITAFNRNIDDWILWTPDAEAGYWSAANVASVWSRGLETRLDGAWHRKDWRIQLRLGYDYIRSTNQRALERPRIEPGEQLIYTPEHQAFGRLSIAWRDWSLTYRHTYSGPVQTPTEPLSGYQLGYGQLQWQLRRKGFWGTLFLRAENLWNAAYRVVERRPMPGRHYRAGLRLRWEKDDGP